MKRTLALFSSLALMCPQLLKCQDTVRQQASTFDLEQWRQRQVAIAEASRVARNKDRERDERALADLERQVGRIGLARRDWMTAIRASIPFDRFANVSEQESYERMHPDTLATDHNQRRDRLAENASSAIQLDAARRTGELDQVFAALQSRSRTAERLQFVADSVAQDAKEVATWAQDRRANLLKENRPDAPAELKSRLRVGIEYFGRLVSYARAIVEFESRQVDLLRAEQASLLQEMSAASGLRGRR